MVSTISKIENNGAQPLNYFGFIRKKDSIMVSNEIK